MDTEMMVELHHVKEYFLIHDQLTIRAVDDISFGIRKGEVFGLVGESGCGKSTVARLISGIYRPTEGEVLFHGNPKKEMQMIFQDSAASLNPRMTVEQIILEPLWIQGRKREAASFRQRLEALLEEVGLSVDFLGKYPGALSGGQRQRVAIARSLLLQPGLIVADEPIASLDISIQAQIVTLLQRLQKEKRFSLLFIAHDLSVVRLISHRVGVMLNGKLVELADTEELFRHPMHPYTKALLSAIPIPDPVLERQKTIQEYDTSQPLGETMTERAPGHFVLE